jgi:hypothetical protein
MMICFCAMHYRSDDDAHVLAPKMTQKAFFGRAAGDL